VAAAVAAEEVGAVKAAPARRRPLHAPVVILLTSERYCSFLSCSMAAERRWPQ
jgi:hypothetical protein